VFHPIRAITPYINGLPCLYPLAAATIRTSDAPASLKRIELLLDKVGLEQEHFVVDDGCPNGCARPYGGTVGSAPSYQVWLGGSPAWLAVPTTAAAPNDMAARTDFVYFKQSRQPGEGFGSFAIALVSSQSGSLQRRTSSKLLLRQR